MRARMRKPKPNNQLLSPPETGTHALYILPMDLLSLTIYWRLVDPSDPSDAPKVFPRVPSSCNHLAQPPELPPPPPTTTVSPAEPTATETPTPAPHTQTPGMVCTGNHRMLSHYFCSRRRLLALCLLTPANFRLTTRTGLRHPIGHHARPCSGRLHGNR